MNEVVISTLKQKPIIIPQVLFKYYITRASETYYENKLIGFAIDWDENSYELNYEDQDRIADIEAQHSGIIDIMRHTKMFINLVAEIGADILKDVTSNEMKKEIKNSSRRNR